MNKNNFLNLMVAAGLLLFSFIGSLIFNRLFFEYYLYINIVKFIHIIDVCIIIFIVFLVRKYSENIIKQNIVKIIFFTLIIVIMIGNIIFYSDPYYNISSFIWILYFIYGIPNLPLFKILENILLFLKCGENTIYLIRPFCFFVLYNIILTLLIHNIKYRKSHIKYVIILLTYLQSFSYFCLVWIPELAYT